MSIGLEELVGFEASLQVVFQTKLLIQIKYDYSSSKSVYSL